MSEAYVTVSMNKLVKMARLLGSQDSNECPPDASECWLKRGRAPRLGGEPVDNECGECWLSFALGDGD